MRGAGATGFAVLGWERRRTANRPPGNARRRRRMTRKAEIGIWSEPFGPSACSACSAGWISRDSSCGAARRMTRNDAERRIGSLVPALLRVLRVLRARYPGIFRVVGGQSGNQRVGGCFAWVRFAFARMRANRGDSHRARARLRRTGARAARTGSKCGRASHGCERPEKRLREVRSGARRPRTKRVLIWKER